MKDPIYYHPENPDKSFPYAYPKEIYKQIKLRAPADSVELDLLFEILNKEIALFTAKEFDFENMENYSRYEWELYHLGHRLLYYTRTIKSQLIQVVDALKADAQYQRYHHLLPDIEFVEGEQNQVYDTLKL